MALNPGLAVKAVKSVGLPFGQLFKQEIASAAFPALLSSLYYGPQYFDSNDPVTSAAKVAGLVGTDLLGSALLSAGIKSKFPSKAKGINPEYLDDLSKLGLKPGATADEIRLAKNTSLGKIKDTNIADDLKKARGEEIISASNRLRGMTPDQYFSTVMQPSGTGELLGNLANYGFSYAGMNNLVVQPLEKAGVLTPTYLQSEAQGTENQGTVPQRQIIAQQIDNRQQNNIRNNAVMSPDTMSQLTSIEIERLMQDALAQAGLERQALMMG